MITCDDCKEEINPWECLVVFGLRKQEVTEELEGNILNYHCAGCSDEGRVSFQCKKPLEFLVVVCEVGTGAGA